MNPDLEHLRALAAVVDEGSFDGAAHTLRVTPSAISQRIKSLEQAAGQVLVKRSRPVVPTDAGAIYLRLARGVATVVDEISAELDPSAITTVPVAVNADSLDTWIIPALSRLPDRVMLDLRREDQADTADLLRAGTVVAAITSDSTPVQGCRVERLGSMTYHPAATPDFVDRWLPSSERSKALETAPVVVYDRRDQLQDEYLKHRSGTVQPPRHHVPASRSFLDAVLHGWGWGMVPDLQLADHEAAGRLVRLDDWSYDVELFWQQWTWHTAALDAVAHAVRTGAAHALT